MMASFFQSPYYPYCGTEVKHVHKMNSPVSSGTNGKIIRQVIQKQWQPALHVFQPEMIFISAGFDAHKEDHMGGMLLVENDYVWITQQ